MYGFCGAPWLSAIPCCCARLKAEVATSVLGGFDLDVSRVIYAIGSLSSAGLIHTLLNVNHITPSTDAADHKFPSNHTAEHGLPSKHLASPASRFEEIRHNVAVPSSGDDRVGDHPDFLAPVLLDELSSHQHMPQANMASCLTYK